MSPSAPLIYAELLSNIRQISIIAALETPCDSTTRSDLSEDGKLFTLYHRGIKTILDLPGQVAPATQLQRPALGSKELSWRLPVSGPAQRPDVEDLSNEGPWSAKSMKEDSEFLCRNCGTVIIRNGSVKDWRDLPSENWAEMMDFWHCHKPSDHGNHGSNGHSDSSDAEGAEKLVTSKGYGASTKFAAQVGVAFVDITTFLLSEVDLTSIKQASPVMVDPPSDPKSEISPSHPLTHSMSCATCQKEIGYHDQQAEGIKIWKWALSKKLTCHQDENGAGRSDKGPMISWIGAASISHIISSLVSAIISSQACSRLIFTSEPPQKPSSASTITSQSSPHTSLSNVSSLSHAPDPSTLAYITGSPLLSEPLCLSFWVLSPTVRYSTTFSPDSMDRNKPSTASQRLGTSAMKVFYKQVLKNAAKSLANDPNVEEVTLPVDAMLALREALCESAQVLPATARKFQDWNVGLLDRYEENN